MSIEEKDNNGLNNDLNHEANHDFNINMNDDLNSNLNNELHNDSNNNFHSISNSDSDVNKEIKKDSNQSLNQNHVPKKRNKGTPKFLITLGTYFLLITFVVLFVILKFGLSYNITKVMPDFRNTLYSEPNFYQYNIHTLEAAASQLTSHYNKVKDEIYHEKDYYEEGQRGMYKYNLDNLNNAIKKLNTATFSEAYATLSEAEYIPFITDPLYKYDSKVHRNNLYISLDFFNAVDKGLYYEMPCQFYVPFLINKASFSELPMNATMSIIEYNHYVEGGFMETPFVKRDNALMEYPVIVQDEEGNTEVLVVPVILEDYDGVNLVGYEGNGMRMSIGPIINIRIMKGTYICYTTNYLFTAALRTLDEKWDHRNNPYFPIDEVIDVAQHEEKQDPNDIALNTILTAPYFNYVLYDNRGYITDVAYLGATYQK